MEVPLRSLANHWLSGLVLTVLITLTWLLGWLAPMENWLYDQRAARCQFFMPAPSDQLVYLDIDDSVLNAIAADEQSGWPWPRSVLADMIAEIARAEPAAIALDIILTEPQRAEIIEAEPGVYTKIDHDAALRHAVADSRRTLVPISVRFGSDAAQVSGNISADAIASVQRFLLPRQPGAGDASINLLPLPGLLQSADFTGYFDYPEQDDARLRAIPLMVNTPDGAVPQMGLAMACRLLGIAPADLRIDAQGLHLGDRLVPLTQYRAKRLDTTLQAVYPVPWFGPDDWRRMYGEPFAQHISLTAVWNICRVDRLLQRNNARADEALQAITAVVGTPTGTTQPADRSDTAARQALYDAILTDSADMIEFIRSTPADELDDVSRLFLKAVDDMPLLLQTNDRHARHIERMRADLHAALQNKGIFIGWIASGAVADIKPTSLHDACPGVMIHGVIANGLLTGESWRVLPIGWTVFTMLLAGVLTVPVGLRLSPAIGTIVVIAAGMAWLVFNGVVLFDRFNLLLPVGGPLVVCGAVFATGTLLRLITERIERRRIRARFSHYVDPQLVSYVEENPDLDTFAGEMRRMTVVFNDIANFTPLTRRLGQRTIPLLNEFFADMVPVIRAHNGYVNKFLGDGIMFFYGAPRPTDTHSADAIATVLDLQQQLRRFNERLARQDLPPIGLRAGVSTGEMVVGDAGGKGASDYTVLGDAVNLGARLESANKALDSQNLITAATIQLGGEGFLVRPMGRLYVVGRDEAVECYEALARTIDATDAQKRLVDCTRAMVEAFQAGRWDDAQHAVDRYAELHKLDKLALLYRNRIEYHRQNPHAVFDGSIVLSEK